MSIPVRRQANPLFGPVSLSSSGNGSARWKRGSTSPLDQKGSTGWLAELVGGVQTGSDWARLNIPVDEIFVSEFSRALWSYYMTNTETMGVNIVVWVHDPNDFDKRAEITQLGGHADLVKSSGWNAFSFSPTTGGMFFYGENTTGTGLTAGTQYTWSQFQADPLFKNWTIYRITLEYGWEASGTFEAAYVADVKLNGVAVPLKPESINHCNTVRQQRDVAAASAYDAEDVISNSASNGEGTDLDFDFGGTGYITKAVVVSETTALTARIALDLYSRPPTCELDDHAANTGPIEADLPYYLGRIVMPGLQDLGTGTSVAIATPSTTGNLPLAFDTPIVYVVAIALDAFTQGAGKFISVSLTADMDD